MRKSSITKKLIFGLLLLAISSPIMAVSSVATAKVKVNRFLSLVNTSAMDFGEVSINSVAGSVVVKSDGSREFEGGVLLNDDSFSPAKFVIEGAQNADYSVSYPNEIVLGDGNGNTLVVDQINTEIFDAGEAGSNGLRELVVGARLNLEAYQPVGDYNGSLIIEIEYK